MTYAPDDLLAVRRYLMTDIGLPGDSIGIIGDPEHMTEGGAHLGNDDLAKIGKLNSDYTKRESPLDRPGSNAASGVDIGEWRGRRGPAMITFHEFNAALVGACQGGDPRAADIREVIYTPDGVVVRRYDRLGKRSTGDSSHLYHTHVTRFRTAEGRAARDDNLLGLVKAIFEGDDMNPAQDQLLTSAAWREHTVINDLDKVPAGAPVIAGQPNMLRARLVTMGDKLDRLLVEAAADAARDNAARAAIDAMAAVLKAAGGGSIDTAAVIVRMNELAAAESRAVATLRAEVADLRGQLAAAARAGAEKLAVPDGPDAVL